MKYRTENVYASNIQAEIHISHTHVKIPTPHSFLCDDQTTLKFDILVYVVLYFNKIELNWFRFFSDQLKGKLNLNIDHMDQLTMDDLKSHVDNAIGQVSQSVKLCSLTCLTVVQILSCVKVVSHLIPPSPTIMKKSYFAVSRLYYFQTNVLQVVHIKVTCVNLFE